MGFLSRKTKSPVPVEEPQEEQPIVDELREIEEAVPERGSVKRPGRGSCRRG